MCGVCGFIGPAELAVEHGVIRSMTEVLRHRGPDGLGDLQIGAGHGLTGWLGHSRLKIIDLTEAADQPMTNEDGSVALTYNGEVYNFRELRRRLEGLGHRFRSTGDTEVVLRAYEQWGEECVRRLDGMFAFAIWDCRRGCLFLARDRTGKKPLYYTTRGGRLTFGSEIKALLQSGWVEPRLDVSAIGEYLLFGYVPDPRTIYEGIHQVPPASTISFGLDGLQGPRQYWDALPERQASRLDHDAPRKIALLLENAVRRRLIADVPLGALLSGGLDSSVVVGLMRKTSGEPVRTFSIGFPEDASYDEREYARLVARHFATIHTEFEVKVDAVALLDDLVWHHDQPFADSSAIPTYLVCKLAREHVTVALNGDGGDEVFSGYERFWALRVSEWLPKSAARGASRMTAALPLGNGYYDLRRRVARFLAAADRPPADRYQAWISVMSIDLIEELLARQSEEASINGDLAGAAREHHRAARHLSALDQAMYVNFKTYLPGDLSVKMDRMSMANSLETRSPFLDTALIEYMARIPARYKVGLLHSKPLLRAAFEQMLPPQIWKRRKHGFGVPMDRWFDHDLGAIFEDEVLAAGARCADYVRGDVLDRLWREHRSGRRSHGARLWAILTFERWLRRMAAREPRSSTILTG
jgi:asparagine synthase (glutamine-hydrolysing)